MSRAADQYPRGRPGAPTAPRASPGCVNHHHPLRPPKAGEVVPVDTYTVCSTRTCLLGKPRWSSQSGSLRADSSESRDRARHAKLISSGRELIIPPYTNPAVCELFSMLKQSTAPVDQ